MHSRRVADSEERAILERAEELLARGVGIPQPENFMCADSEDDFMGAIKIKDGLFIGDEFSAQVGSYLKLDLILPVIFIDLLRTWNLSSLIK